MSLQAAWQSLHAVLRPVNILSFLLSYTKRVQEVLITHITFSFALFILSVNAYIRNVTDYYIYFSRQQNVARIFAMSYFIYLSVANPDTIKTITGMAKVAIKGEKTTPLGSIFSIISKFQENIYTILHEKIDTEFRTTSR